VAARGRVALTKAAAVWSPTLGERLVSLILLNPDYLGGDGDIRI